MRFLTDLLLRPLGSPAVPLGNPLLWTPSSFPLPLLLCSLLGYSVSSMLLRGGRRLFLSGAPRFRHRGKVIAFQLKKDGAVRVAQSLQGEQVGHPRKGGTFGFPGTSGLLGRSVKWVRERPAKSVRNSGWQSLSGM